MSRLIPYLRARPALASQVAEITKFCLVGGMNYVVDVAIFNGLLFTVTAGRPVAAKTVSVAVATLFSWVMNRTWTFRGRGRPDRMRELVTFVLVNVAGALPSLACLWISHHILNLTSALADNISGNVIGLILGTLLRYVCYRSLVFTGSGTGN